MYSRNVDVLHGDNVHMMETANDTFGGAVRGIGARAAETAADPDNGNGDVHCGDAREVAEVDDSDSGGDGDSRSDNALTEAALMVAHSRRILRGANP